MTKTFKNIENLKNQSIENLLAIKGIGAKVAIAVNAFLNDENNWKIITDLQNIGLQFAVDETNSEEIADNPIKDKNFLATGKLQKYKRNDIKDIILSKGGNYLSAVSKNLDFLIAGEKAGSKLKKAQEIPTIKILTEEDKELVLDGAVSTWSFLRSSLPDRAKKVPKRIKKYNGEKLDIMILLIYQLVVTAEFLYESNISLKEARHMIRRILISLSNALRIGKKNLKKDVLFTLSDCVLEKYK